MLLLQNKQVEPEPKLEPADPRKVLSKILTGRAPEVLETARRYYPAEIAELEARLAQAIIAGGLSGPITGEELYSFLRILGLALTLDIKVRVGEGGKLKSLEAKRRG